MLAEGGDDALVAGILPQDVLNHHHTLLHDVVDLGRYQVQQRIDTLLTRRLDLDGHLADGLDGPAHKVHVDLEGVLLQLCEELFVILVVCYSHHDLEFLQLEVGRVVEFTEKHPHLLAQDVGLGLQQEVDVPQGNVLDLRGRGNEGHCVTGQHQPQILMGSDAEQTYLAGGPSSSGRCAPSPG